MATIRIRTPPPREERDIFTRGSDFVRGTSADDFFHRSLTGRERQILEQLVAIGVPMTEALDAIQLGDLQRKLTSREAQTVAEGVDPPRKSGDDPERLLDILDSLRDEGSRRFDTGGDPEFRDFRGDDRYFGKGGNDYIADLRGNNLVLTEDGDDHILLGRGNDRVLDRGGTNEIRDLGGNNLITTRDGDDTITTGNGNDIINAFDGRNVIDAGNGDNIVRGGNGFDSVTVGNGDDLVEIRNGSRGDRERFDLPDLGITKFMAHNFVYDLGGTDNIRATGSSIDRDSAIKDPIFNGNDLIISDAGLRRYGDDTIEAGGGKNIVVDFGGNNVVRTLEGNDIIFTSLVSSGDDDISAGFGNDVVNPGGGADTVRGGPGDDIIFLEDDGDLDRLVYLEADLSGSPLTTDIVLGFDGGLDQIDISTLNLSIENLKIFNAALFGLSVGDQERPDFLIAWDVDRNGQIGQGDFFTTLLADFDESTLRPSNFLFEADTLV